MKTPFFSVIIPLYNKENYIKATLNSVVLQTFANFEIIIIDDVSTDNSLISAQQINDERIHIISHPVNKGLSASRNTGIKKAKAEIIAFLDADDLWKPDFLEKIHQLVLQYPEASLFATKFEEIYPENVIVTHPFDVKTGIINNFFKVSLNQSIYYPSSLCVRKEAFSEIGLYNEFITFAEDVDFNIRAHISHKIAYYNEPLMRYRMASENQITHTSLKNKTITDFDFYEEKYPERKDLKKYLDFHRYVTAKLYKLSDDRKGYKKMLKGIDLNNLNYKQKLLLYAPTFVLKGIKKVKALLIKKGINPTSY